MNEQQEQAWAAEAISLRTTARAVGGGVLLLGVLVIGIGVVSLPYLSAPATFLLIFAMSCGVSGLLLIGLGYLIGRGGAAVAANVEILLALLRRQQAGDRDGPAPR